MGRFVICCMCECLQKDRWRVFLDMGFPDGLKHLVVVFVSVGLCS